MTLIVPPHALSLIADNIASTDPSSNLGVTYTNVIGASNTKASYQQVFTALAQDVRFLDIAITNTFASAADSSSLLDIGIDVAGGTSYTVLVPDLMAGFADREANTGLSPIRYQIPIFIPRGSTVGIRGQTAAGAAKSPAVAVWAFGGSDRGDAPWAGTVCDSIGITNSAASVGTSVTAATTSTWSSWISIGSTTARDYHALLFSTQGGSQTNLTSQVFQWQVGINSTAIATYWNRASSSEAISGHYPLYPLYLNIPTGTQLQVRGRGTTGGQAIDVGLWGIA